MISASTCSQKGIRKGSNVPLDATRHQGGTSAPGSVCVHFWGMLLQFAPLGISELGQRQPDASPTPLSQLDRGGLRAGTQPDPASRRDCRCMILPPSLLHLIHRHTTVIRKGCGSNWGLLFFFFIFGNKYHVPLTWTGEQLAGSIIRDGCSPLPICQSAIIGASVLYI